MSKFLALSNFSSDANSYYRFSDASSELREYYAILKRERRKEIIENTTSHRRKKNQKLFEGEYFTTQLRPDALASYNAASAFVRRD